MVSFCGNCSGYSLQFCFIPTSATGQYLLAVTLFFALEGIDMGQNLGHRLEHLFRNGGSQIKFMQ